MEMKDTGTLTEEGKKQVSRILTLADELDMEIFGCIENLEKISDVLGKIRSLGGDAEWDEPYPEDDPEDLD